MKRATPELAALRSSLIDHARRFHEKARLINTLDVEDAVLELAWDLEREWTAKAAATSRPDAAGPALKRLSESVLKVAGLLAIDEAESGEVPIVRMRHFVCARHMGSRWISSTLKLIDALGRTSFQQNCENLSPRQDLKFFVEASVSHVNTLARRAVS